MLLKRKTIAIVVAGALAVAVYASQTVTQLTANGRLVSHHLVLMNGQLMVPVRDVATFFGFQITVANGVAEMTRPSGIIYNKSGAAQPLVNPGPPAVPGSTVPEPLPQVPVTPPSATVPTVIPPGTVITPSVTPQVTPMPTVVIPGTPVTTANQGLFPNLNTQPPAVLTAAMGAPTTFAGFEYKVDSVFDSGPRFRGEYDQRRPLFNAAWKTDTLQVVTLTIRNTGSTPVFAPPLGSFGVTVFDDRKVGYPPIGVDMQQSPDVANTDSNWSIVPSGNSLMLGPGGQMTYAVVVSMPKDRTVSQVVLSLPPDTSAAATASGATLTVDVTSH